MNKRTSQDRACGTSSLAIAKGGNRLRRTNILAAFVSVLAVFFFPAALSAQVNTATLHGIVTDPNGAVVVGAQVSLTNTDTNTTRTDATDGAGQYNFASLQPGNYSISASQQGFSIVKQDHLLLEVGQVAGLNLTLTIGNATQTVEVTSETTALESTDASIGTVITQQQVQDLPLNGRQFSQLLELAPGVVPIDNSQNAGKAPNFGAGAVSPSVNGQSNRSNTFFVDGILDSDPFFGGFSFSPSVDDIQEFKEESHTDQAEFGQSTGAIVSIITSPGTNHLHGVVFEFLRNTVLDSQNKFALTKLPYHQNQFGGSLGGPIIKNKLFFFANYEGGRQSQPAPNYYTVPSLAELSGNFQGTLPGGGTATIYDPSTFNPTTFTETPFANNTIQPSRINAGMLTYISTIYPKPNFTPTASNLNNFFSSIGNTTVGDQGTIRIDYNLGQKDLFNGRYSQNQATLSSPGGLLELFQTGFNGKNAGGSWLHTYNSTTVSQVTVAYNSINIPQAFATPYDQGALFTAAGLGAGWNEHPGDVSASLVQSVSLSGASYTGTTSGFGPIGPSDTIQVAGSLSKQLGSHAPKFGGSFYRTALYTNYSGNGVTFSNKATWNAACQYAGTNATAAAACPTYNANAGNLGAGGDPVASMLLSLPISATNDLGNDGVNLRAHLLGLFAQDSWTVNHKLTVSYGLRWDYAPPVTETNNRLAAYNIYTHKYFIAKGDADLPASLPSYVQVGPGNTIAQKYFSYFQPRLGIAEQITPHTTVRAGVGRTFDAWGLPIQVAQENRGGWPSGFTQIASTQNLNIAGISYLPSGAPVSGQEPFSGPGTLPAAPLPSGGLGFQDAKWQIASSVQWNGTIEQNLGRAGVATLAYVGSHTQHVTVAYPYNLGQPSTNPVITYPDQTLGGPGTDEASFGNLDYESFQASYRRSVATGLAFNASFTLSRTTGLAQCGGDFYLACIQNPYNLAGEYGLTDLDIPVIFTLNATYKLPFGKGEAFLNQNGLASAILSGFQLNTIFGARSGQVLNPTDGANNDVANTGTSVERINFISNPNTGAPHKLSEWFNVAAFQDPANGTYGNARINSLRGPGYWDDDLSLFRVIPFTERIKLELRFEAFDVFNHPNLGQPGTTQSTNTAGVTTFTNTITSTVPVTGPGANREMQVGAKLSF